MGDEWILKKGNTCPLMIGHLIKIRKSIDLPLSMGHVRVYNAFQN